MGVFRECKIDLEINDNAEADRYEEMIKKINSNKDLETEYDNEYDEIIITSQRCENMDFKLNIIREICEEFKDVIDNASGSVMIEEGDSFYFDKNEMEDVE